ncbi:MAG: hypothetical protein NTV48_00765 [Candidatus Vogelbacteria bacterium]|nr:hypothetical protein [Candidatus Vogelbacteria bacterium]
MQDISKPKKSLYDIFPGNKPTASQSDVSHGRSHVENIPPSRPRKNYGVKLFVTVFVIIAIAAICFALSSFYTRATIQVTPNQGKLFINGTYKASLDGQDGLKLISATNVKSSAKMTVNATGEEDAKTKAVGTITVFNNFSAEKQTWVATTRFETGGLIYRLDKTTVIPGTTKGADGKTVPGQITVKVTADKIGDEYNKDIADFTIPGLKGTPKFDKFSAKIATPIAGGFNGKRKKISDADKAEAMTALKSQIQADILKKMKPMVPDTLVMFDDGLIIKYTEDNLAIQDGLDKDKAMVALQAEATGIMFDKKEFSKYFAKIQLKTDYNDEDVSIVDLTKFKFTLKDKETITPENLDKISFNLEGSGHMVWDYDEKDLTVKLQAVKDGNYQAVFSKFPAIKSALIVFRPPWIRSISSDPNKIKINKLIDTSN